MHNEMTAFCGLACYECPAFLATRADDNEKRAEIAKEWSKQYHADIKSENINCDGCKSDTGRLIGHCYVCEIRKCGMEKKVETCGYCADFPCVRLDFIFNAVPEAKKKLENMRRVSS